MPTVQLFNLGNAGIVRDQPPHTLPPEVWTNGRNVRFGKKGVYNSPGDQDVFGTPSVVPYFFLPVPTDATTYWLYASLAKVYAYEAGVHTNITRQTASVDVDYTATAGEQWNGTLLAATPILNNGIDIPQYWANYVVSTKLAALPNWPTDLRAKVIRSFGRYLVALNLTESTTNYPHALQWSGPADPGSVPATWDYTDPATDAGRIELTDAVGGGLREGIMLGNAMILYKSNSTHSLRFIGGNDIFAPDLLLSSSGILSAKTACAIKKGTMHFVVSENDVITHSGQKMAESVIEEKNREWLFANIDPISFAKSYCFDYPARSEAWFCFPIAGSAVVTTAAIFNYNYNTWTFKDFPYAYADSGLVSAETPEEWGGGSGGWDVDTTVWAEPGARAILAASDARTKLVRLDSGTQIAAADYTSSIERQGLAVVGRDRQGQPKVDYRVVKQIQRIIPKLTGQGAIRVEVGAANDFNETPTWSNPMDFTIGSDKYLDLPTPVVGKLIAVRFSSVSSGGVQWQLEGYDLEMALLGNISD